MKNIRNKVQLIGNLGKDPEIINLNSGKKLAKFSLATSDAYRDSKGNLVENTQWHNIIAWGNQANHAEEFLKKGHEVAIDGKIVHRNYEDKNGDKKYITEIVVDQFLKLTKKEAS